MKKIFKTKHIVFFILILTGILLLNNLISNYRQRPVKMVHSESIWQDSEIQNADIGASSVITWDGNRLKFYGFDGKETDEINGNGYFTNVYFFEDEVVVLDKQLNVMYIYTKTGELKKKIQLKGDVYSIAKKDKSYYVIRKEEDKDERRETISRLDGENNETEIYETDNFIINFRIDGSKLLVTEITTENYAYKSSLNIINGKDTKKYDFDNETILDMRYYKDAILAISNKNLYRLSDTKKEKIELKNFRDYRFENGRIAVLYDNKLEFFSNNLVSKEVFEIPITSTGIVKHNDSYFVFGPTDIIGFVGEKRQFQESFESVVYGLHSNDNTLLITYKYNVGLYNFEEMNKE